MNTNPTPWAVVCPDHGRQFLTGEQYDYQMLRSNSSWFCPLCGGHSDWDDDNYETYNFNEDLINVSKRKKPENETPEEGSIRQILERVADNATRSEKVSFDRKMDNMVSLLAKLKPIEEQILDLMANKTPILDEISNLRKDMVRDCVHPYTHLVHLADNTATCKFCGKTFNVIADGNRTKA